MSAIQAVIAVLCSDVKEIITHKNPDWDSVVSVFLLRQWGRAMFVNIEKAVIRFSEKTVLGTDADHDRDGVVPVDTGKGRFSEHCGPTGRLLNKCAAVLVAEFLKIAGRPELARLLEETRNADNKAEGTATSIPTLMKTAYRCGASQGLVFGWASKMVEAIVRHQQYQYEAVAGEKTLLQWFQLLVEEDGSVLAKEGKPHDAIVRAIQDSMALKDRRVLELSYVVEALQRTVSDKSDIKCLLRFWFGMMQNDQEMFQAEVARIRPIRKFMTRVVVEKNGRETDLNFMVLDQADSPHAHRAAMYTDRVSGYAPADIVLVRNTAGNVCIYTHKGRAQGIDLTGLMKALVWHERYAAGERNVNIDSIKDVVDSERWYHFIVGGCIFNGSLTNERKPTRLELMEQIEMVQYCLSPEGYNRLCVLHRMRPVGKQNQQRRDGDQGGLKVRSSKSVPQGQGDRRQSQHGKGPQGSKPAATATKPEEKPSADIATLETVFDGAVAKTDEKPVVTSAAPVVA